MHMGGRGKIVRITVLSSGNMIRIINEFFLDELDMPACFRDDETAHHPYIPCIISRLQLVTLKIATLLQMSTYTVTKLCLRKTFRRTTVIFTVVTRKLMQGI